MRRDQREPRVAAKPAWPTRRPSSAVDHSAKRQWPWQHSKLPKQPGCCTDYSISRSGERVSAQGTKRRVACEERRGEERRGNGAHPSPLRSIAHPRPAANPHLLRLCAKSPADTSRSAPPETSARAAMTGGLSRGGCVPRRPRCAPPSALTPSGSCGIEKDRVSACLS